MAPFASHTRNKPLIVSFGIKEIGPYYWVGSSSNGVDYYAGQTFKVPESGVIKKIRLFSSLVYGDSNAILSVHRFDSVNHTWKEKEGEVVKQISKSVERNWLEFILPSVKVLKDVSYGFQLTCSGGMLAIAECPWSKRNPYADGMEWIGSSSMKEGKFQEDFDFAFEVDLDASVNAQFL